MRYIHALAGPNRGGLDGTRIGALEGHLGLQFLDISLVYALSRPILSLAAGQPTETLSRLGQPVP